MGSERHEPSASGSRWVGNGGYDYRGYPGATDREHIGEFAGSAGGPAGQRPQPPGQWPSTGEWPQPPGEWSPTSEWPQPPGHWSPTSEWPQPSGQWSPTGDTWTIRQPPRRRHPIALVLIAVIVLVLAMLSGGALGRTLWPIVSGTSAGSASNVGGQSGVRGAPAPVAPAQPGAAGDSSAIAAAVAPTIVDVNTTLGLQGAQAAGTGIVLTQTGEVLTNNHVIAGATSITATDVGNGRTYQATVVGYDRSEDIAVIQLQNAAGLRTAPLGDASKVAAGDSIVALGNAGGVGGAPSAVTGTVTAINQAITASDQNGANAERLIGLIQIAANIQPGDSGGPLIDSSGRVIGVDTAASAGFRFQESGGQGYAIPINQAVSIAGQIKVGHASNAIHIGATAFLGVDIASATGSGSGASVASVVSGSPAAQAGLARGDTIVSIGGQNVDQPATVTTLMDSHHPGDRVAIGWVDASGRSQTATVRLATGPAG